MSKLQEIIADVVADRKLTDDQKIETLEEYFSDLLESLVDDGECYFDHHGGCQGHGYLSLEPGEICPQRQTKYLLA